MIIALIGVAWLLLNALFVCRRLMAVEMRERRESDEHPN
jgi:hypothetical protein